MGPIGSPETSGLNQLTPRKNPEKEIIQFKNSAHTAHLCVSVILTLTKSIIWLVVDAVQPASIFKDTPLNVNTNPLYHTA